MAPESKPQTSELLWPYEEARKVAERVARYEAGRPAIFQSGFGPSGMPHLGTMAELLRPSYVRKAFERLAQSGSIEPARPARLIVFIDDMDGLRKVPENIPNRETTSFHLGEPVSRIPDPFGDCHPSFSEHMLSLLEKFLAPVEIEFELIKSTEMYGSGQFDEALKLILARHQQIIEIIAPTLREENRAGWSPVMPVCPSCGQVNSTLVTGYHPERASVEFSCEKNIGGSKSCGFKGEQSVLGGKAKVGWKVDWALRWYALKVDYELYGKDLIDSARLSGQILKVLGGKPPLGFPFEMFLDEEGHKVSKSVGRGVTVDQWTRYAPIEVLKYFLLVNPRRARKLFLEAIPQYVDDYLDALRAYAAAPENERGNLPIDLVIQRTTPRRFDSELTFGMIMNLVSALGTGDRDLIWNYLTGYDPRIAGNPDTERMGKTLMGCALNVYADFVEPNKKRYLPEANEREQLRALVEFLAGNSGATAEEIEKKIYDLGRENYDKPGKIFPLLYRVLLGQERGPRLGAFIKLATPQRMIEILNNSLAS